MTYRDYLPPLPAVPPRPPRGRGQCRAPPSLDSTDADFLAPMSRSSCCGASRAHACQLALLTTITTFTVVVYVSHLTMPRARSRLEARSCVAIHSPALWPPWHHPEAAVHVVRAAFTLWRARARVVPQKTTRLPLPITSVSRTRWLSRPHPRLVCVLCCAGH